MGSLCKGNQKSKVYIYFPKKHICKTKKAKFFRLCGEAICGKRERQNALQKKLTEGREIFIANKKREHA